MNTEEKLAINRQKANAYMKIWGYAKITCECGKIISRKNIYVHRNSMRHKYFELANHKDT